MVISTLKPMKLYIPCLTYSYPHNVKHPFDIMYLPNSFEASRESFFMPCNDQFTSEMDARDIGTKFINLDI